MKTALTHSEVSAQFRHLVYHLPVSAFYRVAILILALCLSGCVTTTAPDGTRTTRADAKTIKAVGGSALRIYLQSQGVPPGSLDALYHEGETIPGPKQTYSPTHGVNFGVPPGWAGRMDEWEAAGRPPFAPEDLPKFAPPVVSPRQ